MNERQHTKSRSLNYLKGIEVIRTYLHTLQGTPGVYRMVNLTGDVVYVGKAKNLKKRVGSYTNLSRHSNRLRRMIAETATMEFVSTHTEAEALLLESNLIKKLSPRYNILLKDDKSFPLILVTEDHSFPQILKHRGAQKRVGQYFGPFASTWAVNETLTFLQRVFLLRTCSDNVFDSRSRPCLLYQIKRCSAPCVGRINSKDYSDLVFQAIDFLKGQNRDIQKTLAIEMQKASDLLEFEKAAQFRDRIQALTKIQAHQDINISDLKSTDVIAIHHAGGQFCIQNFFVREGTNYGNRAYFPANTSEESLETVLEAFLGQFYAKSEPPKQIIVNIRIPNRHLIEQAMTIRAGRKVNIITPRRGDKKMLCTHAEENAREALTRRMSENATQKKLLADLATTLGSSKAINRIEIYDNSHVSGTAAVGAMVVAGNEGFIKNAYRKFNIKGIDISEVKAKSNSNEQMYEVSQIPSKSQHNDYITNDDYAMMREVLTRRFSNLMKDIKEKQYGQWPDLVLVDGGKGQLSMATQVMIEMGIKDVLVAAIAKGPNRNAGKERIFLPGKKPIILNDRDPVLYFLQRLRDEAHRFAIGTHRKKRNKKIYKSILDEIPGIGGLRKKALLHHFGAAKAVAQAGLNDLKTVDGISAKMANKIYDWFHSHR